MDPYLETHWLDVHGALIAETRRRLNQILPEGLVARMEERIAVESDDDREMRVAPDVFVFKPSTGPWDKPAGGAVVIEAPYRIVVDLLPAVERSVRVLSQGGQLITVIEFISPSNKKQPGLDVYQTKRDELLQADVHIVEIDLVRAGNWQVLLRPHTCPAAAISLYRVTIRTAGNPATVYLYPIRLIDPLPDIQIPLRSHDPKLMLALQPMIETIYSDGRYGKTLNYSAELDPPLPVDDQHFAIERLAAGR
jgi:hypothetical protein